MKQKILKSLLILGVLAFVTGCTETETAKTKEYYDKNMQEARTKVAECKKLENYNEIQQIDCGNAQDALIDNKENRKSVYDNTGYKASDFVRPIPEDPFKKTTK